MIPQSIEFTVEKRRNTFQKKGYEFAVKCRLDNGDWYTLKAYPECPTDNKVEEIRELTIRAMSIYHRHIQFPSFRLET